MDFTNFDAEKLYESCMDVQKLDWTLQQDIQLSKLITKLRNWTEAVTQSKQDKSKALGFFQNGSQFMPQSKFSQEEKEQKIIDLNDQFDAVNKQKFEQVEDLFKMIPLPLFTEKKIIDAGVKFTNCSNKQYFLDYCIKQDS